MGNHSAKAQSHSAKAQSYSAKAQKAGRMLRVLLAVSLGAVLGVAGGCVKEGGLPDFPEYPPTRPFLAEQERLRQKAIAIREFRRRERAKYAVLGLEASLAAWQPIYNRIAVARASKPEQERQRRAVLARAQEERLAGFQPILNRIRASRETQPQRGRERAAMLARIQEERVARLRPIFDRIRAEEQARARRKTEETMRGRVAGAFPNGAGTRRTAP